MYLLAVSLYSTNMKIEAMQLAQTALEGMEQNMRRGPEHLTTLKCKALCGLLYSKNGYTKEATALFQSTEESFESFTKKADSLAAQGSRRLTPSERVALDKIKELISKTKTAKDTMDTRRNQSKETVTSTNAPDTDDDLGTV